MKGYIYLIYNDVNNDIYVGLTEISIEHRFKQHINTAKNGNYGDDNLLYPHIRKVGSTTCKVSCLEEYEYDGEDKIYFRNNLRKMENRWMERLKPSLNVITPYSNNYLSPTAKEKEYVKEEEMEQQEIIITKDDVLNYDCGFCYLGYELGIIYTHKITGEELKFFKGEIVELDNTYYKIIQVRCNSIYCKKINDNNCISEMGHYITFGDFLKKVGKKKISTKSI